MDEAKYQNDDLPKILETIDTARASGQFWTLTINGGTNGGISGIHLKIEKKVK